MNLLSAVNYLAILIPLAILCVAFAVGIAVMTVLIVKSNKTNKQKMQNDVYVSQSDESTLNSDKSASDELVGESVMGEENTGVNE